MPGITGLGTFVFSVHIFSMKLNRREREKNVGLYYMLLYFIAYLPSHFKGMRSAIFDHFIVQHLTVMTRSISSDSFIRNKPVLFNKVLYSFGSKVVWEVITRFNERVAQMTTTGGVQQLIKSCSLPVIGL